MKYLKEFENHTQYEAYIASEDKILPNVSRCVQEDDVHYTPFDPYNGHEYVDLGLPSGTKWATMNIGATSETEYGNYYQYGKGADTYQVTKGQPSYSGTENPLALSADTAAQVWGGSWHMPTSAQCQELIDNTTNEWTTIGGINGCKFTASNGNYLFFPASGRIETTVPDGIGRFGDYWTSSHNDNNYAYYLIMNSVRTSIINNPYSLGYAIRGVVD